MADKDGGPAEAFATPEKEAVSLAQEGWSETTPGGRAGAPKDGEENLDAKLVMAAQAARLSETGALGFVGVEGMNSVIEAVRKHFSSLASQGSARPEEGSDAQTLAAQDAGKLAKLLRDDETVRPLLKEPARMRESDGKYDTLDAVLDDVASFGAGDSSAGNKKVRRGPTSMHTRTRALASPIVAVLTFRENLPRTRRSLRWKTFTTSLAWAARTLTRTRAPAPS